MGTPIQNESGGDHERQGCRVALDCSSLCHLDLAPRSAAPLSLLPYTQNAIHVVGRGLGDMHTPGTVYSAGNIPKAT